MTPEKPASKSSEENPDALVRAHERLNLLGGAKDVAISELLSIASSLPPPTKGH
jgi:hypothetical protein